MLDKNFILAIKILNQKKIDYWICHGTLLGLVRDKKLIKWDNDIDIGVLKSSKNRRIIKTLFEKKGFKKQKKYFKDDGLMTFKRKGGREVDINFYEPLKKSNFEEKMIITEWYVPKNLICKLIDAISNSNNYDGKFKIIIKKFSFFENIFQDVRNYLSKRNLFYKKQGYAHPIRFIKKKKILSFGKLKLMIPKEAEKYLEHIYGRDWKKPKKDYVWYNDSPSLETKL